MYESGFPPRGLTDHQNTRKGLSSGTLHPLLLGVLDVKLGPKIDRGRGSSGHLCYCLHRPVAAGQLLQKGVKSQFLLLQKSPPR